MRIGIDAKPAAEVAGGRGRYVRELLRHLPRVAGDERFVLFARRPWSGAELDERFTWRLHQGREPLWNVRAAARIGRECDVYLTTDSYLTGWFARVPSVIMLHDLIAFSAARIPNRRDSLIQRATLPVALRRAAAVVTPSLSTKRDLGRSFPAAGPKARVVPLAAAEHFAPRGVADDEVLARHDVRRPYVIAVGTIEPRKNLPRLIEAFAGLPEDVRADRVLLLVGASGWDMDESLAAIAAAGDLVHRLGYVSESDLAALYRRADMAAYVSIYEGFGLPVLEAMRCGTAVLTSSSSSLPEVGGDAAAYVDPGDVEDIQRGLAELLADGERRARLGAAGIARAERFDWQRTAAGTLDVLRAAAASSG